MYVPKNRIKTNLYTPGDEFKIENTDQIYIGSYHSLWTDEYYTGKNPEESTPLKLIPINPQSLPETSETLPLQEPNIIALFTNDPDPVINEDQWNQRNIVTYLGLINQSTTDNNPKNLPSQHYPTPTENDYKVGNFKRYFCVKTNENLYLELDKKTYDKLSSKNSNWAHELYTTFQLVWYITGEESQVESTNKNLVLIQEQRSNRKGLKEFLRENYTKFYKP